MEKKKFESEYKEKLKKANEDLTKELELLAQKHLPTGKSRDWHNALMDLGATICKARTPTCTQCPLNNHCSFTKILEKSSKEKREKEAAEKLQKDFSEFEDMHTLIEKYEKREDKESRFIYALDKIQPMINIYTDNGRSWKVNKVRLQMLIDHKKDKVIVSPEVKKYFEDLIELLKKEEKDLFNA